MKILLKKGVVGFEPATDRDYEIARKVKFGEVVEVSLKRVRNYRFHKKFFAMINTVFDNQEVFGSLDEFLVHLKIMVNHCDIYEVYSQTEDGEWKLQVVKVPRSISFEKMGEDEFQEFYSKTVDAIMVLLPQITRSDVERIAREVVGFC